MFVVVDHAAVVDGYRGGGDVAVGGGEIEAVTAAALLAPSRDPPIRTLPKEVPAVGRSFSSPTTPALALSILYQDQHGGNLFTNFSKMAE